MADYALYYGITSHSSAALSILSIEFSCKPMYPSFTAWERYAFSGSEQEYEPSVI